MVQRRALSLGSSCNFRWFLGYYRGQVHDSFWWPFDYNLRLRRVHVRSILGRESILMSRHRFWDHIFDPSAIQVPRSLGSHSDGKGSLRPCSSGLQGQSQWGRWSQRNLTFWGLYFMVWCLCGTFRGSVCVQQPRRGVWWVFGPFLRAIRVYRVDVVFLLRGRVLVSRLGGICSQKPQSIKRYCHVQPTCGTWFR